MNILMAANENVYSGLELVIYTTLTHNTHVNFYIFTNDIDIHDNSGNGYKYLGINEEHKVFLYKLVRYLDSNSTIKFINVSKSYDTFLRGNPNEMTGFTPYTTFRLLADVVLTNINDCLYLDCDTAVMEDISGMYSEYLKKGHSYYACFCDDACEGKGEMVAGVMLMNLQKIRETGLLGKARRNIWHNVYRYPDQDAIRDAGKGYELPITYGYLYKLENIPWTPAILHFTNQLSPKIYQNTGKEVFYRTFPFLRYVEEGIERFKTINFK